MKTKQLLLTIAIFAMVILTTSCGGSKLADSEQIKSFILMTSVSRDLVKDYNEEYFQKLEKGEVKDVFVPDERMLYLSGNGNKYKNPWIEKAREVLNDGYSTYWKLNEEDTEHYYLEQWESNNGWKENINSLNNRIINIDKYLAENNGDNEWEKNQLNSLKTYQYALGHRDDDSVCGLTIIHAWVRFIQKRADKVVKVYDCQQAKDYCTKSANSYYIIYTIDNNFYVLVRLTEEKKSTRFEIETLSRGEELIEIERTLNNYI